MVRRIRTEDRISIYAISTIFKNVSVMYNEDTECALLSLPPLCSLCTYSCAFSF